MKDDIGSLFALFALFDFFSIFQFLSLCSLIGRERERGEENGRVRKCIENT